MHNTIHTWLSREPHGWWRYTSFLMQVLLLDIMLAFVMILVLLSASSIGAPVESLPEPPGSTERLAELYKQNWAAGYLLIFIGALVEEFVFRFLPLTIARLLRLPLVGTLAVALLSSVWFGYVHGGWFFVPIQGIGGFIYSLAYLKSGGFHGKLLKPLLSTTLVHWGFNSLLVTILVLGETYAAP